MNVLDIVIAAILSIGFILGYKDGFVRKLIGTIGFVAAVYFAIRFSFDLGKAIENVLGIEIYLARIIGGLAIFLAIMVLTSILKRIIHPFDKVNNLINQIVGGIVGTLQVLVFLSALFFLLNVFKIPGKETADGSFLYKPVYNVIPFAIDHIREYTPEPKKIIKKIVDDQDSLK